MMQNPPLELSLDGSTGASDDHEVEEGGKVVFSLSLGTHLLLIYGLIATVIIRIVANVENLDCRTLGSYSFFL
jgi:hypothetical protein